MCMYMSHTNNNITAHMRRKLYGTVVYWQKAYACFVENG